MEAVPLIKVTKVTVVSYNGSDHVTLELDAPSPYPEKDYKACLKIETQKGYGVEWCLKALGLAADEVIQVDKHKD